MSDKVEIGSLNPGDKYGKRSQYTIRKITEQGVHWVRDDGDSGKWLGIVEDIKHKVTVQL